MNHCFSRVYRLTTKADYTAVFNERLKINQGCFLVLYKYNDKTYPRLGVIISKRIVKKATARNYLKRIIREGFRVRKLELKGLDLVVMLRPGYKLTDKIKLQKELDSLWKRLNCAVSSYSSGCTDIC